MGGASISSGQTATHGAPHPGHWRSSSHSAASSTGQRMTLSSSRRNQSGRSAQGQSGFAARGAGMPSRVPDNHKSTSRVGSPPALPPTGTSGRPPPPCPPRALRARPRPLRGLRDGPPPCPPRALRARPRRRRTIAGRVWRGRAKRAGKEVAGGGPKGEANPFRVPISKGPVATILARHGGAPS